MTPNDRVLAAIFSGPSTPAQEAARKAKRRAEDIAEAQALAARANQPGSELAWFSTEWVAALHYGHPTVAVEAAGQWHYGHWMGADSGPVACDPPAGEYPFELVGSEQAAAVHAELDAVSTCRVELAELEVKFTAAKAARDMAACSAMLPRLNELRRAAA